MDNYKEFISRKLRETVRVRGGASLKDAVIIGSIEGYDTIGGHKYIFAPTVSVETLGGCDFQTAREFENAT